MHSAPNSHVKMAKVSLRVPDTRVRWSRSYHAETKSKQACLHRRGAREKSDILNINTPFFLLLRKIVEKKVGVTGDFEIFFQKTAFTYIAIHTKTGMLFGQLHLHMNSQRYGTCLKKTSEKPVAGHLFFPQATSATTCRSRWWIKLPLVTLWKTRRQGCLKQHSQREWTFGESRCYSFMLLRTFNLSFLLLLKSCLSYRDWC